MEILDIDLIISKIKKVYLEMMEVTYALIKKILIS
jgi:hypothetical protein